MRTALMMIAMSFGLLMSPSVEAQTDCDKDSSLLLFDIVVELEPELTVDERRAQEQAVYDETVALSEEIKRRQGIGGWGNPFIEQPPVRDGKDTVFVFSPQAGDPGERLRPYLVNFYDRPEKIRIRGTWYPVTISGDGTWSVPGLTHELGAPLRDEFAGRDDSVVSAYVRTEKGALFLIEIPYF